MPIVTVVVAGATIFTVDDAAETHPASFVTVKVYDPTGIPVIHLLVPVPVVVVPPGVLVTVHVPVEGNPLSTKLAVDTATVGCVITPTIGAVGVG